MNTEHTNNQIITGDYTFNGQHYNALIKCSQSDFDQYVSAARSKATTYDNIIVEQLKNESQLLHINGMPSCSYDQKHGMMYGFIFSNTAKMKKEESDRLLQIFESYSKEEINEALGELFGKDEMVQEGGDTVISDKELVIEFIAFLEGYAIRFKEFHWNAGGKSLHEAAEKAYDLVYALEDSIAEDMMGWMDSKIKPGSINPVFPAETCGAPQEHIALNLHEVLNMLKDDAFSFYTKIENNNNFIGIRSELENFLHEINQLVYLAKLV